MSFRLCCKAVLRSSLIALLAFGSGAYADVSLPRILSDGIVLQRDQPINIWGWATEEQSVTVSIDNKISVDAKVKGGKWLAQLPAQHAGGPHRISVKGNNTLYISDVLIGELWVASGQSNMEFYMHRVEERFPEEFQASTYPLVRQFRVPKDFNYQGPREDLTAGSWQQASAENIRDFSAVAYFFAKELQAKLNVPIGILVTAYGGATAQGWMSEEALQAYPHHLAEARQLADAAYVAKIRAADKAASDAWYSQLERQDKGLAGPVKWYEEAVDYAAWDTMNIPGYWEDSVLADVDGVVWFKRSFELPKSFAGVSGKLKLGRIIDADRVYVNGVKVGETYYQYPPRRYDIPADVVRSGKNTITVRIVNNSGKGGFVPDKPYSVAFGSQVIDLKGPWHIRLGTKMPATPSAKFDQYHNPLGFYNAMLAPLLNLQIKGVIWYQGESNVTATQEYFSLFPALIRDWRKHWQQGNFPFIFVQLSNLYEAKSAPGESSWAEIREAQRLTLKEPNTAMAVAFDIGEWNDIHPVDKKTVGQRLALGARHLAYGENALIYSGPQPKSFQRKGNRLIVKFDFVGKGLVADGKALAGFAIAGDDKTFYWAEAEIKENTVVLQSKKVSKPVYVRYAWADNPDKANLYNRDGLPAVSFEGEVE